MKGKLQGTTQHKLPPPARSDAEKTESFVSTKETSTTKRNLVAPCPHLQIAQLKQKMRAARTIPLEVRGKPPTASLAGKQVAALKSVFVSKSVTDNVG